MIDDGQGSTSPVLQLDELLLDAKLSMPQPRRGSVSRSDLIDSARASGRRVVGITAPAGYGKSTLLNQWAHAEDRRVGWVSLDRLDDDPGILLTLLASAYARISPGNADLVADMNGHGVSVLGRAAPRLASTLRTSPEPFVLMLDDLHELQSPVCHDALSIVISGVPPGSQFVAASRSEQPHMPRLRASGEALEFKANDMALDAAGAGQIFSEAAQVRLTEELAEAVTQRTEGWPVGLYLAALIAKEDGDHADPVAGDDRYVADYLYRESLMHLPEDTQRFLRRTAVADQLSGPLCDALLGGSGTDNQLRELEAASLFLIPLDRRRGWYRYHALFREFLLGELRRVEPGAIPKLHLRAADWYETNGSPALAIEHLLHTDERERCAQLVAAMILPTYQAGQMSTVQRWLEALGRDAIEAYPPLAVLAGWVAALAGRTAETERWTAIVDAASFDAVPLDGTASFDSARAMLRAAVCGGGPEQMLADASFAVAEEPAWSPWLDTAFVLEAEALRLSGDVERAHASFTEAARLGTALANADNIVLSESELAVFAMDRASWEEASEHLERALGIIDERRMFDYPMSVLAFAGAARLSLHRGELKEADRELTRAMRARPTCTYVLPYLGVGVRLQLAKVSWAIGDHQTTRHLFREIEDILLRRPALGALADEVSAFRESIASSANEGTTGGSPLTPAELRLLPYLQTHLTFRAIADRLFVSRNTVSSEVSSIYRKLGVSSRSDAVEQATAIGLLGG